MISENKDLSTNSLNSIKSFQSDQGTCLLACNRNYLCNFVVYNLNGFCSLCRNEALNELVNSEVGQETVVLQKQE